MDWYNKVYKLEKEKEKAETSRGEAEKHRAEAEKGRTERDKIYQKKEFKRQKNENQRIESEKRRNWVQEENLKILEEKRKELENIPLKNFSRPEEAEEEAEFETFFTDKENTTEWIKDKEFKKKVTSILDHLEDKPAKPETYSNALLDVITEMDDKIVDENWDTLVLKEREKLIWEQKSNIFKQVFLTKDIVITSDDFNTYKFLTENLEDTFTDKTKDLNGFKYKGKKIIQREKDKKTFRFLKNKTADQFLLDFNSVNKTANTIFTDNLEFPSGKNINKQFASDYIENLREEQIDLIRKADTEGGEFFEMKEFNDINEEIEDIRKNRPFKIRAKVWKKSLGGWCQRFGRLLKSLFKRHWYKITTMILTAVGIAFSILTLDKALNYAGKMGQNIKQKVKDLQNYISQKLKEIQGSQYFMPFLTALGTALTYIIRNPLLAVGKGFIGGGKYIVNNFVKLTIMLFTGLLFGSYYFFDTMKFYGLKLKEFSYLLVGKDPPKENTEEIVKMLVNETFEDYRKKYLGPKNYYKPNPISKASSYIASGAGEVLEKTGEGGDKLFDLLSHYLKQIFLFFFALFVLNTLIKWRN